MLRLGQISDAYRLRIIHKGCIGIMEKKMETTWVYRDYIGVILKRDNGQDYGKHYSVIDYTKHRGKTVPTTASVVLTNHVLVCAVL